MAAAGGFGHRRSAKYQVLPLDASVATRMVTPHPSMSGGRKVFTYVGVPVTGQPRGTGPDLVNTSYTITKDRMYSRRASTP